MTDQSFFEEGAAIISDALENTLEVHPEVFIRILSELAVRRPEVLKTIQEALELKGHWLLEQAAGLDALAELRRMSGER